MINPSLHVCAWEEAYVAMFDREALGNLISLTLSDVCILITVCFAQGGDSTTIPNTMGTLTRPHHGEDFD